MNLEESLLKAVAATGVPLDRSSSLSVAEKFYLLGETTDEELLRVGDFFGILMLAASAVLLKGEELLLDRSWLESDECKSIVKFFRSQCEKAQH